MNKEMLNTKDVAEYLNITHNQVYKLLKSQKIPGTRITGKWLFPKNVIDEWIRMEASAFIGRNARQNLPSRQVVVAGNNDYALDYLARTLGDQHPDCIFSLSNVGSIAGLQALRNGNCHVAAVPFPDSGVEEDGGTFIHRHLSGIKVVALNLAHRMQGLIVKKGNPLKITELAHLTDGKATFINRQKDSGTRILLDGLLKKAGVHSDDIRGYSRIACTHTDAALEVFRGSADAGFGILAAAHALDLDFVPVATERFDLIIREENYSSPSIQAVRRILNSERFKLNLAQMNGYDVRDTGKIVYEYN